MRKEKPLPKESSFKEFAENTAKSRTNNSSRKPSVRVRFKDFGKKDDKPDRRKSRGNSFKEERRTSSKFASSKPGEREMFDAVCMKCNKPCKVPFKPTRGKGVSCSDCFDSKGRGGNVSTGARGGNFKSFHRDGAKAESNKKFAKTNSGVKELFDAVCMKCNNPCKVPFKPTGRMGVSCSNCFDKEKSPFKDKKSFDSKKKFSSARKPFSSRRN